MPALAVALAVRRVRSSKRRRWPRRPVCRRSTRRRRSARPSGRWACSGWPLPGTYPAATVALFAAYLRRHGVAVVAQSALDLPTGDAVTELPAADVYRFIASGDDPAAEAVLVPDTALTTTQHIAGLEGRVGQAGADRQSGDGVVRLAGSGRGGGRRALGGPRFGPHLPEWEGAAGLTLPAPSPPCKARRGGPLRSQMRHGREGEVGHSEVARVAATHLG